MSHTPKFWHCRRRTSFTIVSLRRLLNHYYPAHRSEANFYVKCNVQNCQLPFTKYNSFYKHVKSHHKDLHDLKYVEEIANQCVIQEEEQHLHNSENCQNDINECNQSDSEESYVNIQSEESATQVEDESTETEDEEDDEDMENCVVGSYLLNHISFAQFPDIRFGIIFSDWKYQQSRSQRCSVF